MENFNSTQILVLQALSVFKLEVGAKYKDSKSVNYKTIITFCESLNYACGREIIKVETRKGTLHTYKTSNRLRYNDSYKEGVFMIFDCALLGKKFEGHSKETNFSYNLTSFFYRQILESPLDFMKKIFGIE